MRNRVADFVNRHLRRAARRAAHDARDGAAGRRPRGDRNALRRARCRVAKRRDATDRRRRDPSRRAEPFGREPARAGLGEQRRATGGQERNREAADVADAFRERVPTLGAREIASRGLLRALGAEVFGEIDRKLFAEAERERVRRADARGRVCPAPENALISSWSRTTWEGTVFAVMSRSSAAVASSALCIRASPPTSTGTLVPLTKSSPRL
jgi:hypothetical protein